MAKKKVGVTPAVTDRTYWMTDLSFMPPEDKNGLWMAMGIFYSKLNAKVFLDPKRCKEYRKLERLELDEAIYKQLIDPITPMGGGGKAEYFASDWKANPIDVHLDNIVRAKLDKIGIENKIQVSEIDKFAKSQKQKDKDRIIFQREFRNLINEVNEMLHLPPIKESQTPYNYVKSLSKEGGDKAIDSVDTLLDYIKSQIKDNQDITLYETYIYKGDIERAFELGIEHYLINLNKWKVKCQDFNNDLKLFNKACGRWYTDETNGRGTAEYLHPDRLYTSPFKQKNGEDIQYWHYEYPITFAEFVRQFGTTLTDEQLKEVFELNKQQGGQHGMTWNSAKGFKGSNANIMIGVFSVLTQDAEKFAEKYVNGKIPAFQRKPLSWLPEETETGHQRIYNTWYSCYYIPPPSDRTSRNMMADWAWQSQYIFNIKKDIDMYRYGVDMRYAKSTLVIWKDDRPSFTDIKQAFMPKIHTTWHKFQNCLIQDTTGIVFDKDLLGGLLNAVDEGNKINPADPDKPSGGNGVDAAMESWRMLKQGGMAWMQFRDKNGNLVVQDPSKLFINIDSHHLDKAERYLKIILEQYNMMTMALAQNDITEGAEPKPRTPVAGIQATLAAATNGLWFIEMPVREFLIMFAERCTQHILCMIKERKKYGFKQRWEEFENVIGLANCLMLEGVEDLHPEDMGLTVSLEDVRANQQYVLELANHMADNAEIGREAVGLVMETAKTNYKYAYCLLMVEAKKKQQEKAHMEELAHQRQMELQEMQFKTAMMLTKGKADGKDQNIVTEGKVQAMVNDALNKGKAQTLAQSKEQLKNNKLEADNNKARLERENKTSDALSPSTT